MTPYILNLLDLILTLYATSNGGVELNPLMQSVPVMIAYKVAGVGVLCWWLHVLATDKRAPLRAKIAARKGLRLCTTAYSVLFCYHLYFILGGILL